MSGFDSLTPNAPIVPPKYLSVTGSQVSPPSVLLQTPPPVVPTPLLLPRDSQALLRAARATPCSTSSTVSQRSSPATRGSRGSEPHRSERLPCDNVQDVHI